MNVKVSIVIPVYDSEAYLDRAMSSVLSQTLKEIEIILVDDGSTDSSPSICDSYRDRYPDKVRVIHKENGGLTSAWKAGSLAAVGEYTGYVDSDDTIAEDMFERLYERALKTDADIVCCGLKHLYEDEDRKEWTEECDLSSDFFTPDEIKNDLFPILINDGRFMGRRLLPNRVTKLTRTGLIKANLSLCSDDVSVGEDFQFSLCMFLDAGKVAVIPGYFPYNYHMHNSSMTMVYDKDYMKKIGIMHDNLLRISKEKARFDFSTQLINDYLCLTVLHVKGGIYKKKNAPYKEHRSDMKEVLSDPRVIKALKEYDMPYLTWMEKLFIFLMKHKLYMLIYLSIKIYFK